MVTNFLIQLMLFMYLSQNSSFPNGEYIGTTYSTNHLIYCFLLLCFPVSGCNTLAHISGSVSVKANAQCRHPAFRAALISFILSSKFIIFSYKHFISRQCNCPKCKLLLKHAHHHKQALMFITYRMRYYMKNHA